MADYVNKEYVRLLNAPIPLQRCPKCGEAFEPFLRGLIKNYVRAFFWMKSSCVICRACKEIVGHE